MAPPEKRRTRDEGTPPGDEQPERLSWKAAAAVAVVVAGLVVWRTCSGSGDTTAAGPAGSASASAGAPAGAPAPAREAPRCAAVGQEPLVIGADRKRPAPSPDEPPEDEQLAPFAVEVGRGAPFEGGFAVGALRDGDQGAVAMVATLGRDGSGGKLVKLARSRGDMDPPHVTGAGKAILAAMLEPNAGGRAIRLAKVEGEQVTWGPELAEGRDESLALDLSAAGERAVIVWDDVTRDGKRSQIMMASVDTATLRSVTTARPISGPKVDAEVPRIIARPGGYWLAYIARSEEGAPREEAAEGEPKRAEKPGKKPDKKKAAAEKKKAKKSEELDEDTEAGGETIGRQWIELMPLDETGSPTASARAVTPRGGHVLAFDMALGEDGAALLAFQDDDTPSGSSGGHVSVQSVGLGHTGEPRVVAGEGAPASASAAAAAAGAAAGADDSVGSGVPALLPGWLAVALVSGGARLGALSGKGEIVDALLPEEALGGGEPIAAADGALLVARPAGTAMKLSVVRCAPGTPRPAGSPAAPPEGAGSAAEVPGEVPGDGTGRATPPPGEGDEE